MPDKSRRSDEDGIAQRLRIVRESARVRIDVDPSLRDGWVARELLAINPVDDLLDRLVSE
jgi:hypothetical protein